MSQVNTQTTLPGVYWRGGGGNTPYNNLCWFLALYTYLICHSNLAYTGIYQRLVSSVYPPLFLAIHHWTLRLPGHCYDIPCVTYDSTKHSFIMTYGIII